MRGRLKEAKRVKGATCMLMIVNCNFGGDALQCTQDAGL